MYDQKDRPLLYVRGLVTRGCEDPSVDIVLRAFEPEIFTRVNLFALEGSSRELGNLGKLARSRA